MAVNLDRFACGLSDPQEVEALPVTTCIVCGCDLYEGDDVIKTLAGFCCDETECLLKFADAVKEVL